MPFYVVRSGVVVAVVVALNPHFLDAHTLFQDKLWTDRPQLSKTRRNPEQHAIC